MHDCILLLILYDALCVWVVGFTRNASFELYICIICRILPARYRTQWIWVLVYCYHGIPLYFNLIYKPVGRHTATTPSPAAAGSAVTAEVACTNPTAPPPQKREGTESDRSPTVPCCSCRRANAALNGASGAARMAVTGSSSGERSFPSYRPPPPRQPRSDSPPPPAIVFLGSFGTGHTRVGRAETGGGCRGGGPRGAAPRKGCGARESPRPPHPARLCPPEVAVSSSSRLWRHPASLPPHWPRAEVSLSSLHPFSQSVRGSRSSVPALLTPDSPPLPPASQWAPRRGWLRGQWEGALEEPAAPALAVAATGAAAVAAASAAAWGAAAVTQVRGRAGPAAGGGRGRGKVVGRPRPDPRVPVPLPGCGPPAGGAAPPAGTSIPRGAEDRPGAGATGRASPLGVPLVVAVVPRVGDVCQGLSASSQGPRRSWTGRTSLIQAQPVRWSLG